MSNFSIRLARPEDAEAFHEVETDAATLFSEEGSLSEGNIPPASSAEHHRKIIARGHSLTALVDENIVGFAAAAPVKRELHLNEISVARVHQGKRIGATLLEALAIDAHNSGFRAITLNTFRDIPWNAPFYARHGFVEVENLEEHAHLMESRKKAAEIGLPIERRCAMIRFLD